MCFLNAILFIILSVSMCACELVYVCVHDFIREKGEKKKKERVTFKKKREIKGALRHSDCLHYATTWIVLTV